MVGSSWRPGSPGGWWSGSICCDSPLEQQITGFAVVALVVVGLILPLARELGRESQGSVVLADGSRVGRDARPLRARSPTPDYASAAISISGCRVPFSCSACSGAVAAIGMGRARSSRAWLRPARQLHIILFWPALALLGLHVFACYYF